MPPRPLLVDNPFAVYLIFALLPCTVHRELAPGHEYNVVMPTETLRYGDHKLQTVTISTVSDNLNAGYWVMYTTQTPQTSKEPRLTLR